MVHKEGLSKGDASRQSMQNANCARIFGHLSPPGQELVEGLYASCSGQSLNWLIREETKRVRTPYKGPSQWVFLLIRSANRPWARPPLSRQEAYKRIF